jgi:hypothetical protein
LALFQLLAAALVPTATAALAAVAMQVHMVVVAQFPAKVSRAAVAIQDMLAVVVVVLAVEDKITLAVILAVVAALEYLVLFQVHQSLAQVAAAEDVMATDNLLLLKVIQAVAATARHTVQDTEYKVAVLTTVAAAVVAPIRYIGQAGAVGLA